MRPWPVALALDGQAPRAVGVVPARCACRAVAVALANWPALPINASTVGGLTIGEVLANLAPVKQRADKRPADKALTTGQQRWRDWQRVRESGRRSAGQRRGKHNPPASVS